MVATGCHSDIGSLGISLGINGISAGTSRTCLFIPVEAVRVVVWTKCVYMIVH